MSCQVDEVLVFTRLLDGHVYLRCACGHIRRCPGGEGCPRCGRRGEASTEAEYIAARRASE